MKFNSFEDLSQIRKQFTGSEVSSEIDSKSKLEFSNTQSLNKISPININEKTDTHLLDKELLENVVDNFLAAYWDFNAATDIKTKEDIIKDICFFYEDFFLFGKEEAQEVFLRIEANNDMDISLFSFIFSLVKVAGIYNLPGTYKAVERYFRSSSLEQEEKNYLMSSLPKHFLEIMEETRNEEYEHSLYSRLDSKTFITRKDDGLMYMSKSEDMKQIINNWSEADSLEKIEIVDKVDKDKLDNIVIQMNNVKKELSDIYSSEYSSNGKFLGLKYSSENELIEHTNTLKTLLEKFDQKVNDIIRKNNPDIDLKFSKVDELHRKVDSLFVEKFTFEIFKKKLVGLNLNVSELYINYLTFWAEPNIRKFLEADLGFYIEEHTFQQQVYFLDYLKDITKKEAKELKKFSEKYNVSGFNCFLSIAHGGKKMAGKILELGEKLPKEAARKVFEKYGEIINQVDNLEYFIRKNFSKNLLEDPDFVQRLRDKMLKKGQDLLLSFGDTNFDLNQAIKDLDNLQLEKELLFLTIKLSKDSGENMSIEDIMSLDLKKITPSDVWLAEFYLKNRRNELQENQISKFEMILDERDQMEKMYKENYSDDSELQEHLINDFHKFISYQTEDPHERLNSADAEVFILKYGNKVVAFDRFDRNSSLGSILHFKSFNVDKESQKFGIGSMMFKATIDKKAAKHTIVAECDSSKPISSFYIENGFIARSLFYFHGKSGLSILRTDSFNVLQKEFKTKTLSKEEIIQERNLPEGTIVKKSFKQEECDFSLIIPENFVNDPGLKKRSPLIYKIVSEKYALTRYFFNKETNEWITVFEPIKRPLDDYL